MRRQTFGTQMQGQDADSASPRAACKRLLLAGLALSALTACASGGGHHAPHAGRNVGVLLPLSGNNARLGQEMLTATRMAMNTPTAPTLDVHDTAAPGSSAGAAAQAAVAAGDGLILGPLTTDDTAQAAKVSVPANIPMLAFTSDISVAQPGVWALGIAPEQQVRRMVLAAHQQGRQHFAAFLPNNRLGQALGQALQRVCEENGLQSPQIMFHDNTQEAVTASLKILSAYDSRAASVPQPDPAAVAEPVPTPAAPTQPDAVAIDPANPDGAPPSQPVAQEAPPAPATPVAFPPPPFDALLLGDTGLQLGQVINALAQAHVDSTQVQIMGPGLWGAFASKLGTLQGAWYAAPDPASRQAFVQQFMARYHHMPTPLADLTYDSAALVKALDQARPAGSPNGYSVQALTRPDGFGGVDGAFGFLENGRTRRDLAVFQILPGGGSRIVIPPAGRLRRSAN